jgi:hypothetical protein
MADVAHNRGQFRVKGLDAREIRVFLCYRRQDGAWHADWLYRHLNNTSFTDPADKACRVRIYYDKTAPGVSDWKQLHFPSLQTSQAIILVCTPGIAIDFSRRGQPDWVYEELRWWCGHRDTAPIVVDTTGEGDRWLPQLITLKWPDINRIDLNKDDAEAAENTSRDFAQRIRERITDSIRESERRTVFEDLQRFKRLTKRLSVALSCAVFLLFVAVITTVWALKASERAEQSVQQRIVAEQSRAIAQKLAEGERSVSYLETFAIREAVGTGRYAEALQLQEALAAKAEAVETEREGKPGEGTAHSLNEVAWRALFARDFMKAWTFADRAHALLPENLLFETNRAYALMFLERGEDAKDLYLAHKGKPVSEQDARLWERVIAQDFAEFRKAGLTHPMMAEIEKELGVSP